MIELEELIKEKKGKGSARAPFLAYKEQIEGCLVKGYTKKITWEVLTEQGILDISYSQFCTYVKKYIKVDNKDSAQKEAEPIENEKNAEPKQENSHSVSDASTSFQHNAKPDKNNLV